MTSILRSRVYERSWRAFGLSKFHVLTRSVSGLGLGPRRFFSIPPLRTPLPVEGRFSLLIRFIAN